MVFYKARKQSRSILYKSLEVFKTSILSLMSAQPRLFETETKINLLRPILLTNADHDLSVLELGFRSRQSRDVKKSNHCLFQTSTKFYYQS